MQSETIADLAAALSRAQGAMPCPPKNRSVEVRTRDGRSYKYAYADLPIILDTVRKPLAENGLAVSQVIRAGHLVTLLTHSSGQFISSEMPLELSGPPQEIGSRLTYLRRYSLTSLLNLAADEDDDASATVEAEVAITPRATKKNSTPGKVKANPGEYEIPFGTHAGKRPADLRLMELEAFLGELTEKMHRSGKTLEMLPADTARLIRELREDKDRRAFEAAAANAEKGAE